MLSKIITPLTTKGTANTLASTDIQVSTINGTNFSYPSKQPKSNMPNPINDNIEKSTNGSPIVNSQRSTTVIQGNPPPYSAYALQTYSTSRSMGETNVITNDVNPANFSQENVKRRSFFFLLKDRLAEYVNSTSYITCCDSGYDNMGMSDCNLTNWPQCCPCIWMATVHSSPPCGTTESEGAKQFATRIALGLTYMYQDIIPLLDPENNKRLTDYFVYFIHCYFFQDHDCCAGTRTVSIYSILMSSLNRYLPGSQNCNVKDLKTVYGLTFSFNHILSLGVHTIDGSLYEATNPRNVQLINELKNQNDFPLYRQGTSDAIMINLLEPHRNSINLQKVKDPDFVHINLPVEVHRTSGSGSTSRQSGKDYLPNALLGSTFKEFWNKVDHLANSYLSQNEFQSYTQLIPAESRSDYLLKEVNMTDNGGGS